MAAARQKGPAAGEGPGAYQSYGATLVKIIVLGAGGLVEYWRKHR